MMRVTIVLVVVVLTLSCDGGLTPPPLVEPGFGGTITFVRNTWPPRDSLVNLWLVASQDYPLDSVKIFTGIFSNPPRIYIYPGFDRNLVDFDRPVDTLSYSFFLPPGEYKYICVLHRLKDEINVRAIRVVGLYGTATTPPQPIPVVVRDFEFVRQINMTVNFHKLPPQPF